MPRKRKVSYQRQLQELMAKRQEYAYGDYALHWNVKVHYYPNTEHVLDAIAQYFYINRADLLMQYPRADEVVEKQLNDCESMEFLIDRMRESVTDGDTYYTVRPEVAKKWKLGKDVAQTKPLDVKFEFMGRSGGHLCVTEFEGRKLADFLDYNLYEEGDPYDDYEEHWCQKLLAMIDEWDQCFTSEAVNKEAAYLTAWEINSKLEDTDD